MSNLNNIDRQNIWHPFTSLQGAGEPLLIASARGMYLHTHDGKKIMDAISSWWVNLHGHAHPRIANAIADQASNLEHVIFAGFTHEPAIRLSQNLLSILPDNQKKIFFSDNGSTAVEVGLKMAFQYWHNQGIRKNKVIAIKGAYHGDTFGSMSVAERGLFTKPFSPYLFEASFIDFPQQENAENVMLQCEQVVGGGDVAAFIFEPLVQAAGGMRMYAPAFLDRLITCAQSHGVICIADEVFTGFGRTGKNFASDHLQTQPDIMALSKGITGGFLPMGVTACSARILSAFDFPDLAKTFFHGHSYTANPIACAAANASFDLLMEPSCTERIQAISQMHTAFVGRLRQNKHVTKARSLGTILALELVTDEATAYENSIRGKIYPYFLEKNILLRPLGNVLYVLPPYIISKKELELIYTSIEMFLETA